MRVRRFILLLPMILLAACGGRGNSGGGGLPGRTGDSAINWPNDPTHVVFQIDVVGGPDTFDKRNDIPLCTVYGDSRVVWLGNSQPGQTNILFDVVNPVTIRDFVLDLVVNFNIYEYQNLAEVQVLEGETPVYEQIILHVNDERHITDGFAGWPTDFFTDILNNCRNLSQAPARFEPTGGWMSSVYTDYDPEATIINWNAEASGIDLAFLTESEDEYLWVDNDVMPILWNTMINSPRNRIFEQDDAYFKIAYQIPNVHRTAPPAPTQEELADARSLIPEEGVETE